MQTLSEIVQGRIPRKGGNLRGTGGTVPELLGWGHCYLYPPTISEVSGDVVVTAG